ncbi:PLPL8 phospholipase, partial [Polyodon spathula]|nr:PLPL8 phospholipase [Polyodon spathula]
MEEEEGECTKEVLYESTAPPLVKKRTFLQYLTQPTGTVQELLGSYLGMEPGSQVAQPSSGVTTSGDGRNRRCVVSLGTSRYDSGKKNEATWNSLRSKICNFISSATDTKGVHTLLDNLLPVDVYFRFNPLMSAYVLLDESRAECLDQLRDDTELYLQRNRPKLQCLSGILQAERGALQTVGDWLGESAWMLRHRWS